MEDPHPPVALEDAPEMQHEVRIHLDENATGITMHIAHDRRADVADPRPVFDDHPCALEVHSPQQTFEVRNLELGRQIPRWPDASKSFLKRAV